MSEVIARTSTGKKQKAASLKPGLWAQIVRYRMSYLFLAPFMLLFIMFTVVPVFTAIGLSFTYYNILESPRWVGLLNYKTLFVNDDIFLKAVGNTLKFAVITGPVGYCMSFVLAWLIHQIPHKYRFFYTLCFYTPAITSGTAVAVVWAYLFSGDRYGMINSWAIRLGILDEPWLWLKDVKTILPVLILVSLWMSMGVGFLAFLAGLANVSREMYEAATIDGVKYRWQELWYVTLPAMKPQLLFGAVLTIVSSLQVFDISVALAGNPSTLYAGHVIMTHLNDYAFVRFEMGYAAAIAVVLFLLMVGLNRFIFNILGDKE
ncbi:carbohydrate ABC transporter permease [Paenibacillus mendelii]|uniref:Carbohydrate ABC transporter permease n=1 Tax=Paenibacillus mendelii TaxID=206163 RepID=A0ABV6JBS3_9BACL|nr:sugar ABC transporter permease [Paenibacillus mendelii]MCQ6563113.1 sugar ABC transporter permease [Paenibacillus mendelii]